MVSKKEDEYLDNNDPRKEAYQKKIEVEMKEWKATSGSTQKPILPSDSDSLFPIAYFTEKRI